MANTLADDYRRDGFVFPVDVLSATDVQQLRADLEAAENQLLDQPQKLALLRAYPEPRVHVSPAALHWLASAR